MRVYRNNIEVFNTDKYFPVYQIDGICYAQDRTTRSYLQPRVGIIAQTGSGFKTVEAYIDIKADHYYRLDGVQDDTGKLMWTMIDKEEAMEKSIISIFDIMEITYSGKDMGERKVTATIKHPTPIDLRIGDFIEIQTQSLQFTSESSAGSIQTERFYIYTEPQCKKTARPMMAGDAFEIVVSFYPPQYELGCIILRDHVQMEANASNIIYTGFDTVSFIGGAQTLLERCMACLNAQYVDNDGEALWSYDLAPTMNEVENTALEQYAFSFTGTSIADVLLKLNDPEYINTTFFINGRTIYVGYKRPFVCKVNAAGEIDTAPLLIAYGKTSHLPINHDSGLAFNITKTIGEEVPITKLFAYGATRNINRYYCSDLIGSGRFVNKLMLPSFSNDGKTDFIISEDGVKKFGIREGSKDFEIFPSLQHMTYADIRGIKYCIKAKCSGISSDLKNESGYFDHVNSASSYPIIRIQCYKVTPCTGVDGDGTIGANKLVECAPPEDLVITVHATGKFIKCILRGGSTAEEALAKQIEYDGAWSNGNGRVPAKSYRGTDYIPGACFCVHDNQFKDGEGRVHTAADRDSWFTAPVSATTDSESELHRIEYVDTFWITDVYVFESYNQMNFRRDGYSAWAWARLNNDSGFFDTLHINELVAVEEVVITDTSGNIKNNQKTWDIYLRDTGFSIDEQNDFGESVFVFDTVKVSMLDGLLTGREFTLSDHNINDYQSYCICALNEDGTRNDDFFLASGYTDATVPQSAYVDGAIWRLRLNRLNNDGDLQNLGIIIPTKEICAKAGDHITLLDIYMPDVYVRAAERRLLREAQVHLHNNDKGSVKYAVEFDKVRINQVSNYALQLREGVRVRLVDSDLNITTENTTRKIVDYPDGMESLVPMYTVEQNVTTETVMTFFRFQPDVTDIWNQYDSFESHVVGFNEEMEQCTISLPRKNELSNVESLDIFYSKEGGGYSLDRSLATYTKLSPKILTTTPSGENWLISFKCTKEIYDILVGDYRDIQVEFYESIVGIETYKYSNYGKPYYAIVNEIVNFLSGKYYEVVMDVEDAFVVSPVQFMLSKSKDVIGSMYCPAYTVETVEGAITKEGFTRIKVSFFLSNGFDDSVGYYPIVKYMADGATEYASIYLISVTEKDLDELGNVVNYADNAVEQITIKILDNTRSADTRILGSYPEPIKEVTATLNNNVKATSWAKVLSRVSATEQEIEAYKSIKESLVKTARDNARAILSLRNSIFDPDATTENKCDYTFLHIMMMQLGADSMNYLLDKTYQDAGGALHNCSISRTSSEANPVFNINNEDKLHHLVFTDGSQDGHWTIKGPFSQTLQPNEDGSWSPYFVCIRCRKDGDNALNENAWICSKHQYAVNQDINPETGATTDQYGNLMTDYWYFNWAILTCPDNDGSYVLRETRGNAYMYGDSLICGKISSLAQNSYFDLNTGNFVLGGNKDGSAALSYIDGKLTIGGIPDEDRINELIEEINKMNNLEIGGENLFRDEDWADWGFQTTGFTAWETILRSDDLEVGKYMLSGKAYSLYNGYAAVMYYTDGTTEVILSNSALSSLSPDATEDDLITTNIGGDLTVSFEITKPGFLSIIPFAAGGSSNYRMALVNVMLQKGTKATSYQPYVNHLTSALKGSTEIAGGLMMTNLLMLKSNDESIGVVAGMSGIKDDNSEGELGDGTHSEGVTLWGGGTYAKALVQAQGLVESIYNMLPVLLTKTGINSRIGCLRIVSSTQVAIDGSDDTQIIIDGGDEDVSLRLIKGGVEKIHITSGVISAISTDTKTIALDYSYNEGSWKVLSNVNEGGKTVNLATIPLSSSNYAVSYNCNYLKVIIGVHLSNIGPQVSNVKIKFGVYIGNYCIGYANASVSSLQTSSIFTQLALYVRVNKSMSNLSGGTSYGILIKDVSVTCVYGGSTRNMNCVLISMALGTGGNSSDTWVEGGTITLTTSLTDKVTIASNGVQVESSTGLVQIMNGKGGAYIKMFGLPGSDSDLDEDQLYRKTVSFEDFKESLKTTLAEQYFSVKSGVSYAVTQLADKLPDSFDTVGIK